MGYGWLWFVAIHSRGNHSHILLPLPTEGHLWRQACNDSVAPKCCTIQINDSSHPQSKLLQASNMFQSHSYSSQIWRPLTFHQTLIDISWVQKNTGSTPQSQKTYLICLLCVFVLYLPVVTENNERNSLQATHGPRVSRNSIKTRYACGSQLSKVMKPLDFTSKCCHNLTQLGKRVGFWCEKDPFFMTLHVDTVKAQDGRRHQRFEKKFGEKRRQCPGGWHTQRSQRQMTQAPKVRNKWRETTHQAHLASKWTSLYIIYPRWGAWSSLSPHFLYYGHSLFNIPDIPKSSHRPWSASDPNQPQPSRRLQRCCQAALKHWQIPWNVQHCRMARKRLGHCLQGPTIFAMPLSCCRTCVGTPPWRFQHIELHLPRCPAKWLSAFQWIPGEFHCECFHVQSHVRRCSCWISPTWRSLHWDVVSSPKRHRRPTHSCPGLKLKLAISHWVWFVPPSFFEVQVVYSMAGKRPCQRLHWATQLQVWRAGQSELNMVNGTWAKTSERGTKAK